MPARSNIPPEAFEEICSGKLGFREARRIYGIGHARYKKIQQRVEAPPSVVPPPIAFRKREWDTSGEILEELHALSQDRPDLFLSHEEYKVLVGVPKTAEKSYTFVHLRNFPRQLRELYRLQYHYALTSGYVQDIVEMRVHTRGKSGFVVFERLLVEDYERFPPEYSKNRVSAHACRCGSKGHGKKCILKGPAKQETLEAGETQEGQEAKEASGTQKGQETLEAGGIQEGQEAKEAGGTQEGHETLEAGETQEDQETGEAKEVGGTQENRWELPKRLLTGHAVWNIQNNDDMCLYWSIRVATKLRKLQEACQCGRGEDCIWQRI